MDEQACGAVTEHRWEWDDKGEAHCANQCGAHWVTGEVAPETACPGPVASPRR